jgi:hypothetical protein
MFVCIYHYVYSMMVRYWEIHNIATVTIPTAARDWQRSLPEPHLNVGPHCVTPT